MTALVFVLVLIVANGVFAMSEIAVVSANRVRLKQRAEAGSAAARRALELAENPNRFLSTVQVGITLIGVFAGAFGGATLAAPVAAWLARVPWLAPYSGALALVLVVAVISYLSLVVGELAPKRIGLNNPEAIAMAVAGFMHGLSVVATPIVVFLSASTEGVLWLLRIRPSGEPRVSEEEIAVLVEQGRRAGLIEPAEQEIIENAFWLGEQRVNAIMTPRPEVARLDRSADAGQLAREMAERPFSRYLVTDGGIDDVIGVVHTRDLLTRLLGGGDLELATVTRDPLFVPETLPIFDLLDRFREAGTHFAVVLDEYGGVEGIATMSDIIEELVGEVANQEPADEPELVRRNDGSLLADGLIDIEDLTEALELPADVSLEAEGYRTLGGFIATRLARLPQIGDVFEFAGYSFEVVDMDRLRVDRVLIAPLPGRGGHSEPEDDATPL